MGASGHFGEGDRNAWPEPRPPLQRLSPPAEINGRSRCRLQLRARRRRLSPSSAGEGLAKGMTFEWTDLTYQRILAGNSAIYVYPLCILLVFLVLAAQ